MAHTESGRATRAAPRLAAPRFSHVSKCSARLVLTPVPMLDMVKLPCTTRQTHTSKRSEKTADGRPRPPASANRKQPAQATEFPLRSDARAAAPGRRRRHSATAASGCAGSRRGSAARPLACVAASALAARRACPTRRAPFEILRSPTRGSPAGASRAEPTRRGAPATHPAAQRRCFPTSHLSPHSRAHALDSSPPPTPGLPSNFRTLTCPPKPNRLDPVA